MLRLNPNDNQGARYRLLSVLLGADRPDEAEALLAAHDEASALWSYAGVLVALKKADRVRVGQPRGSRSVRGRSHQGMGLDGRRRRVHHSLFSS
jgi:hypothetical protein